MARQAGPTLSSGNTEETKRTILAIWSELCASFNFFAALKIRCT